MDKIIQLLKKIAKGSFGLEDLWAKAVEKEAEAFEVESFLAQFAK